MESTVDESRDVTVTDMGESISVFVPISWKRTGGRKQIVLPDDPYAGEPTEEKPSHWSLPWRGPMCGRSGSTRGALPA